MPPLLSLLTGGDRRSIGRSPEAVQRVLANPALLAELIAGMCHADPLVRMRSADAAEKVSVLHPELLQPFKPALLQTAAGAAQQEVRWHLAQMLPRLTLTPEETSLVASMLEAWLDDRSAIVRTFSMQALADLALTQPSLLPQVTALLHVCTENGTPAMQTRGRKLLRLLQRRGGKIGA